MPKSKPLPPLELVEQLLDYDPETGIFRWKPNRDRRKPAGKIAGALNRYGYVTIKINGRVCAGHRLAWLVSRKEDPMESEVDHINGNKADNRKKNLRLASRNQNRYNCPIQKNNTSGFKGVSPRGNKWRALIYSNGKRYFLGDFPTPELAHMAYCKAAAELHGDFARTM